MMKNGYCLCVGVKADSALILGGRLGIRPEVLIAGMNARLSAYEKLACEEVLTPTAFTGR